MPHSVPLIVGLLLFAIGALVVGVNLYTSFLRYPLHRWRGGTRADFRWVSGFPIVGFMCLLLAAIFLTDYPVLMWSALATAFLDISGPHWLAGSLIYMLIRPRQKRDGM